MKPGDDLLHLGKGELNLKSPTLVEKLLETNG